jgi:hypothetical protein
VCERHVIAKVEITVVIIAAQERLKAVVVLLRGQRVGDYGRHVVLVHWNYLPPATRGKPEPPFAYWA